MSRRLEEDPSPNYYICSFIYNSPIWYLRRSDEKTAEKALKQFRSNNHNIQKELSELKLQVGKRFVSKSCSNCFNGNTTSRPVSEPQLRPTCGPDTQLCKPFLTLNVLFVLMLFSGKFAIEMYAVDIFKQTQDSVDENTATVILGKGVDIRAANKLSAKFSQSQRRPILGPFPG